jgi:hypothetical protein
MTNLFFSAPSQLSEIWRLPTGLRCFIAGRMPGCLYSIPHARTLTIFLELNPRTSLCPMAQPLPALAHGNLFRTEDGQDRLCGVLGIHAAGKKTAPALPEVDFRDGQLRAAEAEKPLAAPAFSNQPKNIAADSGRSRRFSRESTRNTRIKH